MMALQDSPETKTKKAQDLVCVFDTRVVTGSGGGPDKTILNSPRFLTALGYHNICGYLHPPGDGGYSEIERKASKYNAPLYSIPDRGPWDYRVVRELLKICKQQNVQIWHGHDYKTNALGLLLKRFHRMRLVTTVHGWVHHTTRTPLYYKIDKLCLPRYELVIGVSQDLVESSVQAGVKAERCVLVENAIDTAEFTRSQAIVSAKAKIGILPQTIHIGAVGRLEPEKAFDLIIHSIKALTEAGLDVRLTIIGEGSDRPRLEALAKDLDLTNQVHLPGWQSDVRTYYEAMDIFALSSLREGLPNVLLEAMALEVPCVATKIAGIPKLIQHEQNGLLVTAGNQDELNKALFDLVQQPNQREALRLAGRRTIETRYSFPARMQTIARLYDELLAKKE